MKQQKKYRIIVKAGNEKFVKYRCNNLLSFVKFLNEKWSDWRWFNVYSAATGKQLDNFTRNKLPLKKWL